MKIRKQRECTINQLIWHRGKLVVQPWAASLDHVWVPTTENKYTQFLGYRSRRYGCSNASDQTESLQYINSNSNTIELGQYKRHRQQMVDLKAKLKNCFLWNLYLSIRFPYMNVILRICCINRFTSLCKNLFNLLEFLAEAFRCHLHHFQCLTVPVVIAGQNDPIYKLLPSSVIWTPRSTAQAKQQTKSWKPTITIISDLNSVNGPSQETEETSRPTRPVENVVLTTKGLQERNTTVVWDDGGKIFKIIN